MNSKIKQLEKYIDNRSNIPVIHVPDKNGDNEYKFSFRSRNDLFRAMSLFSKQPYTTLSGLINSVQKAYL